MKYVRYIEEKQKFYIKSWPHPSWQPDVFYFPDNMTEDDVVFSLYSGLSMQIDEQVQALKKRQNALNTAYEQWLKENKEEGV